MPFDENIFFWNSLIQKFVLSFIHHVCNKPEDLKLCRISEFYLVSWIQNSSFYNSGFFHCQLQGSDVYSRKHPGFTGIADKIAVYYSAAGPKV